VILVEHLAHARDLQVVLAKFAGALGFYVLMWLVLLPAVVVVSRLSNGPTVVDLGAMATLAFGISLVGSLFMAVGCFTSALTRSQIIAAVVCFALCFSLVLLSQFSPDETSRPTLLNQLVLHLSLATYVSDFAQGIVDSRPVVLCLSMTAFFLFLTWRVMESRRWK